MQEKHWINSPSIHDNDSHQSWYGGNTSQHNEGHLWQAPANIILNGIQKAFHLKSEDKNAHSHNFSLMKYWMSQPQLSDERKKQKASRLERMSTIATLCRLHGTIYKNTLKSPSKNY